MMITRLTTGQQITIPAVIRKQLGLKSGSTVELVIDNGVLVVRPLGENLDKLFATARKTRPKKHLTAKEMDALTENGRIHR